MNPLCSNDVTMRRVGRERAGPTRQEVLAFLAGVVADPDGRAALVRQIVTMKIDSQLLTALLQYYTSGEVLDPDGAL
jgi:hypothetical protein